VFKRSPKSWEDDILGEKELCIFHQQGVYLRWQSVCFACTRSLVRFLHPPPFFLFSNVSVACRTTNREDMFNVTKLVKTSSIWVFMLAVVVYYRDSWSELCTHVLLHPLGTSLGLLIIQMVGTCLLCLHHVSCIL
jgi:hypothetical protein